MHESARAVLTSWSNFYVITGSAAAALTGLVFVVITIVAGDRARTTGDGISTFSTPTIVHFCVALFVSAVLSAPWQSLAPAGVVLALTGVYGVAYASYIVYGMRTRVRSTYRPQLDDWLSYAIVPLIAYAVILGGAVRLAATPTAGLFTLAGGTLLLIFLGIHNAWDVVTFIAIDKNAKAGGSGEPDDSP